VLRHGFRRLEAIKLFNTSYVKTEVSLPQPLPDNRTTAKQKNSWLHTQTHLDPAQKNNIHRPTISAADSSIAGNGGIGGNA
jgi:hypothetical protein